MTIAFTCANVSFIVSSAHARACVVDGRGVSSVATWGLAHHDAWTGDAYINPPLDCLSCLLIIRTWSCFYQNVPRRK